MKHSKILRRCYDFVEAEAIRTRLDAAGILAVINGAEAQMMLSYVGTALGGVKLEVAPEDYDRAVKLLDDDESRAAILGPWICERCNEQNEATFELCWSCQKPRDQDDRRGRLEEKADPPVGPPTAEPAPTVSEPNLHDRNPYRPVLLETDAADPSAVDSSDSLLTDAVRRAYVASIIGTILLPPLVNLYSIALLVFSRARPAHTVRQYRGRLALAWTINVFSITFWIIVWLHQWSGS